MPEIPGSGNYLVDRYEAEDYYDDDLPVCVECGFNICKCDEGREDEKTRP